MTDRGRSAFRSRFPQALGFAFLLVFGLLLPAIAQSSVPPELEPFEPFVGKTWKGLVSAERELYDVARWERALAGQAVKIVHSVGGGSYGGETTIMWDRNRKELVYYYFTTAGFYTHGTMSFDEDGRLVSFEEVEGHEGGVTAIEATQEMMEDGRLRVSTRMLTHGEWKDRGEVVYVQDPEAEVVLPDVR